MPDVPRELGDTAKKVARSFRVGLSEAEHLVQEVRLAKLRPQGNRNGGLALVRQVYAALDPRVSFVAAVALSLKG